MAKPDFQFDRDFPAPIPPLAADELTQLEASLLAVGCREPLIVWKVQGNLLDGHHRLCLEHDIAQRRNQCQHPPLR